MREPSLFDLVFFSVLLFFAGWLCWIQISYFLKRFSSRRWPSINAIVERGAVGRIVGPKGSWMYGSFLGYTFVVQDVRYSGHFAIISTEARSRNLQDKLTGATLGIRYSPTDPGRSFVADPYDPLFEGLTMTQNPEWLDQSPSSKS
jgi:hypothetical protein